MNDRIKPKIKKKNSLFKQYAKNGKNVHDYQNLQSTVAELSDNITERKYQRTFQVQRHTTIRNKRSTNN